jgi:hypothetical protein
MDSTDPETGTKLAFLINDFHKDKIEKLRPIEAMAGFEAYIVYRKGPKSNGVVELESLNEFPYAQSWVAHNAWPLPKLGDRVLVINGGHADLNILVDYEANKATLAAFLKTVNTHPSEVTPWGIIKIPAHPAQRRQAWKSYDHALYDGSDFGAEETGDQDQFQ